MREVVLIGSTRGSGLSGGRAGETNAAQAVPRLEMGFSLLEQALEKAGYRVSWAEEPSKPADYRKIPGEKIYAGIRRDLGDTCMDTGEGSGKEAAVQKESRHLLSWLEEKELLCFHSHVPEGEGFYLQTMPAGMTVICGGSASGVLYGCQELAQRIETEGEIPAELAYYDAPAFKLRGPCVGLQKTKLEPPRHTYEYPITPDRFPWFYDKGLWQDFLDRMLSDRCNVLYIWSGHPFSSLVRVPDYPEALEVTQEEFEQNRAIFGWLTAECDRRGIWVVLKFYNIHISLPFAQTHGLDLVQSNIHPLVADYTYKSIVEFIKSYPNIGLMVCLGEALRGTQNKTDWFAKTIIPAVKQGVLEYRELSGNLSAEEPPVILRGHDCDPVAAMDAAMPQYSNLYTMWKYNGESLTTYLPRGKWQQLHQKLSSLSSNHIMNVHILANLEPFRFMAPSYIQKCVQAGSARLGANGLHLYPLFYWDWPYSPDVPDTCADESSTAQLAAGEEGSAVSAGRPLQLHRDWMWFSAWFRYAWNAWRDEAAEKEYWTRQLAEHYHCPAKAAAQLLDALEAMGLCGPKILGRVGITEGNRQTMSLGMTMSQLTNVIKYRPNYELWRSVARVGEQPDDYWKREVEGLPHVGETPYDLTEELFKLAERMESKAVLASSFSSMDDPGLTGIFSDLEAVKAMTLSYCYKIRAAMKILEYKYRMDETCAGDVRILEEALEEWEISMEWYRTLTALTKNTYLFANSMQTPQRKIPFPNGETFGHWSQCLPEYEKELQHFKENLKKLKAGWLPGDEEEAPESGKLPEAPFTLESASCETYVLRKGERLFTDSEAKIQSIAPEIDGMTGIRFGMGEAIVSGVTVRFTLTQDAKLLVGYFNDLGVEWLQVPELETNTHADDRGGLAVLYANALKAQGCNAVHIHAFTYEKGTHELYMGTGAYVIAGIIPADTPLTARNAGLEGEGVETLDWLYHE